MSALPSPLVLADAALRRGLARSRSVVESAVVLPSYDGVPSVRYEVLGPVGGRHSFRLHGEGRTRLVESLASGPPDLVRYVTLADLESTGSLVGARERARVAARGSSDPSSIRVSTASVAAVLDVAGRAGVRVSVFVDGEHGEWEELVDRVLVPLGEGPSEGEVRTVTAVLTLVLDGVPLGWALRRAGASS